MAFLSELHAALGGDDAMVRFFVFLVCGAVGASCHYLKKWLRDEIQGSLIRYLVVSHPKDTVLSVMTFFGAACAMHLGGQLAELTAQALIMLGFTTGYTVDSAVNKGDAP